MTKPRLLDAWKHEDYRTSHIKGKLRYLDHEFLMVKEKVNGAVHPKYYALVTVDRKPVACGSKNNEGRGSYGPQTSDEWLALFERDYGAADGGRERLKEEIERIVG